MGETTVSLGIECGILIYSYIHIFVSAVWSSFENSCSLVHFKKEMSKRTWKCLNIHTTLWFLPWSLTKTCFFLFLCFVIVSKLQKSSDLLLLFQSEFSSINWQSNNNLLPNTDMFKQLISKIWPFFSFWGIFAYTFSYIQLSRIIHSIHVTTHPGIQLFKRTSRIHPGNTCRIACCHADSEVSTTISSESPTAKFAARNPFKSSLKEMPWPGRIFSIINIILAGDAPNYTYMYRKMKLVHTLHCFKKFQLL